MPDEMQQPQAERLLVLLLRLEAVVLIFALPAMFMPTAWMVTVHGWLGLGPMPSGPIVEYLTRSLSALYAGWAPIFFYMSYDVRRYLGLIVLLSVLRILLGAFLIALDIVIGMPWFWTVSEGPGIIAISILQWYYAHKLSVTSPHPHT